MSKISVRFLVGFVAVTAAGAAAAQNLDPASLSNSVSSQISSVGSTVSDTKLNTPSSALSLPTASSPAANMMSALKASGSEMPIANAKLGTGSGVAAPSASNPFAEQAKNSIANAANALSTGADNALAGSQAVAFIGAGTTNMADTLAAQATTSQRIQIR
ncbi:hypothetical protein [Enterovirga rhinocerotis]|uniref:Killing trait domain-containing protein n=1 Tax=Enterovirga rhinocerotis TaxID=1339210 RepID=A0A4R7BR22_9HYPH|nr:hypothetical protein [Enterovirga rhinocerotis]TDR88124.1 hypothetical protein EV668_3993 [Enterovirga rhinocerotis]